MQLSRRFGRVRTAAWPAVAVILPLAALSAPTLAAQEARTLSYGEPEEVGMSRAVLEGALGLYHEAVERGELVGAVVLIARKGKIVLHEAVGMRDKEQGLPMERNSMFRMASNTKPVVATAIARLVEEGKLSYDDLVREYIPEWDNYRAGFITIDHLLSHSSGLRIRTLFLQPLGDNPTLRSESARFGPIGAEVTPGETYSYNNPGYNTLGALVEIASGQVLEDRLRETVYGPLGMDDSYNHRAGHPVGGKLDRMGAVYYQRGPDEDWAPGGTPGGPVAFPFARASGGMISTTWGLCGLRPDVPERRNLQRGAHPVARIGRSHDVAEDPHRRRGGRRELLRLRVADRGRYVRPRRLGRHERLDRSRARDHRVGVHPDPAR